MESLGSRQAEHAQSGSAHPSTSMHPILGSNYFSSCHFRAETRCEMMELGLSRGNDQLSFRYVLYLLSSRPAEEREREFEIRSTLGK